MSASVASSNFFGSFGRKAALAWGWGKGLMGPITNVVMCCKYVQLLLSLFLMAKWLTNGGTFGVHDFRNQWGTVWGHWYIWMCIYINIHDYISLPWVVLMITPSDRQVRYIKIWVLVKVSEQYTIHSRKLNTYHFCQPHVKTTHCSYQPSHILQIDLYIHFLKRCKLYLNR